MNNNPDRWDRWFPLVPRQRPPAEDIRTRVDRVLKDADLARNGCGPGAEAALARAFNRAALIASDAHLPDLARTWCWQHAELHLSDLPLTSERAILALEPVVNLARLDIRAGQPQHALETLNQLLRGLRAGTPIRVQDRLLPLDRITRTENERAEVYRWAWSVYLGDGMRALAAQGRWAEAAERAHRIGGVGRRLLDGRQVTILAHLAADETEQALRLTEESQIHEAWERCVQLLLHLRCHPAKDVVDKLVKTIRTVDTPLFVTRTGLTAIRLMKPGERPAEGLLNLVVDAGLKDAYAARDLRTNASEASPTAIRTNLSNMCVHAGLGRATLPDYLISQLQQALKKAVQRYHATT